MAEIWKWSNLTLAFVMELVALGALGFWGWRTGDTMPTKLLLGIGTPVGAAVLWGLFAAPQAQFPNPVLAIIVKLVVFGGAAAGLWAIGHRSAAVVFAVVVAANLLAVKLGHLN